MLQAGAQRPGSHRKPAQNLRLPCRLGGRGRQRAWVQCSGHTAASAPAGGRTTHSGYPSLIGRFSTASRALRSAEAGKCSFWTSSPCGTGPRAQREERIPSPIDTNQQGDPASRRNQDAPKALTGTGVDALRINPLKRESGPCELQIPLMPLAH